MQPLLTPSCVPIPGMLLSGAMDAIILSWIKTQISKYKMHQSFCSAILIIFTSTLHKLPFVLQYKIDNVHSFAVIYLYSTTRMIKTGTWYHTDNIQTLVIDSNYYAFFVYLGWDKACTNLDSAVNEYFPKFHSALGNVQA